MAKRKYIGSWWLPDKPNERVGGILTVAPSGSCELQLTEALVPSPYFRAGGDDDAELEGHPLFHGYAHGEEVTILNPLYLTGGVGPPFDREAQLFKPQAVIVGAHLTSTGEEAFTSMEIEVDNLTPWSSISGFKSRVNPGAMQEQSDDDYWVRYQLSRPQTAMETGSLVGFKVELKWRSTFNPHIVSRLAGRHLKASESVVARFESPTPLSWDGFLEVTKMFQDLLTFATRQACSVRSCHLVIPKRGESAMITTELHRPAFVKPKPDTDAKPGNFLFRASDVSFADLLDLWGKLHSKVGLGVHVLLGLDYARGGYVENRIMNATAAAESIHRALFPNAAGLLPENHASGLEKIKAALGDHDARDWFLGRLRNDPGFADRMHELAEVPSQEAVLALLQNVDQWARWLRDARNAVAHLEGRALAKIPDEARFEIPDVTVGLLHLVFLAQLGFSSELQLKAVNKVYAGKTEHFRNAVKSKVG